MQFVTYWKNLVYQKFPRFIFRCLTNEDRVIYKLKKYNFSMLLSLGDNAISRPILVKGEYEQSVTQVLLD